VQAVTYATLGAGTVTMRDWESFDLSQLNRDPDNLQEILSETEFAIEIPGINLERWRGQVEDSLNLIEAIAADIPDDIKVEGRQAIDQFRDLILNGASAAEAAKVVKDPWYREMLKTRLLLQNKKLEGTLSAADEAKLTLAILQGEKVYFDDVEQEFRIVVDCATSGFSTAPCGSENLQDFRSFDEQGVKDFITGSPPQNFHCARSVTP